METGIANREHGAYLSMQLTLKGLNLKVATKLLSKSSRNSIRLARSLLIFYCFKMKIKLKR